MLNILNRFPVFILVLIASRLVILGLLHTITHGREISNDVAMHIEMIGNPFCILAFTCPQYDQYPPLLPLFETWLGTPAGALVPPMLTIRFVMIVYELIAAFAFFRLVTFTVKAQDWRALLLMSFIASPMMFMTSTVMGANTTIGGAFVLIGAWLALRSNASLATFVLGLGTVAGKQFLVLPMLAAIALQNTSSLVRRALAGFIPLFIIFGGLVLLRILQSHPLPLLGFKPDPYFGTNFWVALRTIYDIDISKFGTLSGIIALGLALIPVGLGLQKAKAGHQHDILLLAMSASLVLFFSLFYHVNPDYFVMCVPLLLIVSRSGFDLLLVWLVMITPWIGKFLQLFVFKNNVGNDAVGGKEVIFNAISPSLLHYAEAALVTNQIVFSALTIFIGILLCRRIVRL